MSDTSVNRMIYTQDGVGEFVMIGGYAYVVNETSIDVDLRLDFYNGSPWGGEQWGSHFDWTMYLQRYNPLNQNWETIGTRTGYLTKFSPSDRTFTGIKRTGHPLRVKVKLQTFDDGDGGAYRGPVYMHLGNLFVR